MADKKNPFDKYSETAEGAETPFDQYSDRPTETLPLTALAGEQFLNSIFAAPDAMADLFMQTAAGMGGPAAAAMAPDVPLPRPTIGEIGAGTRALFGPGTFTEDFGREMAEQDVMRMNTERESPVASQFAPLAGDALALATGRIPFLNKLDKFEDVIMTINKPDMFFSTAQVAKAPTTVRSAVSDAITKSPKIRKMLRGLGRATEAGLEATILDIVNGNDPGETFGYAAGTQLASSALLEGGKSIFSGPASAKATKLTATLFVGAALWQQLQLATPIDDNFLEAINASGEKILLGLAFGAAAGLAGGGRLRGNTDDMSRTAQTVIDSITTVPRGTLIGMIRQLNDAPPEQQQAATDLLQLMTINPEAFTAGEMSRISSAMEKGTLPDTATVMMRDKRFVERVMTFEQPSETMTDIPWEIQF